ncbi:glycosyltransferase [Vibrio sp. 10N.247.311.51]|uniref:glycosyltransferase n=1 Tax=Vibrio sp. 10N.247.311.51 TaxID=3229996 RepID=UPI00354B10B8
MIYHICRGDAEFSSRIILQKSFIESTKQVVIDKLPYVYFNLYKKAQEGDVFIFHQHAMLINLVIFYFFTKVINRKSDVLIVFDIHDLNEIKYNITLKGYIYYAVLFLLESIVFKLDIKFMTVSNGLSKILYKSYGIVAPIVYNIPIITDYHSSNSIVNEICKKKELVYFGQINQNRLPIEVVNRLLADSKLDVYGYLSGESEEYLMEFNSLKGHENFRFLGKYKPRDVSQLLRNYDFSVIFLSDNRLNIRYCMPNKLFQSLSCDVPVIASDNLFEIGLNFSSSGYVISVTDYLSKNMNNKNSDELNIKLTGFYEKSKRNFVFLTSNKASSGR